MIEKEYIQTQETIITVCRLVAGMPLREFIADGEHADAVGLIVDPTLWMKAQGNLGTILDLARGLRNFQEFVLTKIKLGALPE